MTCAIIVVCCGLFGAYPAFAQEVPTVVRVTAVSAPTEGRVTLTLRSGAVLTIPFSDIDLPLTAQLNPAMKTTAPSAPAAPSPAPPLAEIRTKCARDWPDDFSTRAYCDTTQQIAVGRLQARLMASPDQQTTRTKCQLEWSDDVATRNSCEQTQFKALAALGR